MPLSFWWRRFVWLSLRVAGLRRLDAGRLFSEGGCSARRKVVPCICSWCRSKLQSRGRAQGCRKSTHRLTPGHGLGRWQVETQGCDDEKGGEHVSIDIIILLVCFRRLRAVRVSFSMNLRNLVATSAGPRPAARDSPANATTHRHRVSRAQPFIACIRSLAYLAWDSHPRTRPHLQSCNALTTRSARQSRALTWRRLRDREMEVTMDPSRPPRSRRNRHNDHTTTPQATKTRPAATFPFMVQTSKAEPEGALPLRLRTNYGGCKLPMEREPNTTTATPTEPKPSLSLLAYHTMSAQTHRLPQWRRTPLDAQRSTLPQSSDEPSWRRRSSTHGYNALA